MSTETTDRRERVCNAIDSVVGPDWRDLDLEMASLDIADAVLAALEPWLLPDVSGFPRWAWSLVVEGINSPIVSATVEEWVDDDSRTSHYLSGSGSIPAAAIRAALESGTR